MAKLIFNDDVEFQGGSTIKSLSATNLVVNGNDVTDSLGAAPTGSFVPYEGADSGVDLGSNSLTATTVEAPTVVTSDIWNTAINGDIYMAVNDGGIFTYGLIMYSTGEIYMPKQSYIRAVRATSDQSHSGSGWEKVIFNSTPINPKGEYSTGTGRFTAQRAGNYIVSATAGITTGSGQYNGLAIYKNGVSRAFTSRRYNTTVNGAWTISAVVDLSVGQYIEIYVYSDVATTINVGTPSDTTLTVAKIS